MTGESEKGAERPEQDPADRPQLSRNHQTWRMQNRNHAREPPSSKLPKLLCHVTPDRFQALQAAQKHVTMTSVPSLVNPCNSQLSAQSLQNTSMAAVVSRLLQCHLQRFWNVKASELLVGQNQQVMQIC